jgi:N-[(2S)-2-amino-2-carboxyethyl]-L-glutamate dehydrogenase
MTPDCQSPRRVLYLSRADVVAAGGGSSHLFLEAVERALVLHAEGDVVQPLKPYLRWRPNGHVADRIIAMPAYVGGDEPVPASSGSAASTTTTVSGWTGPAP